MDLKKNTDGINPTADFIENQHTGHFVKILPDTFMIKGAKNDRGFDQAYALKARNKNEYILIDVVEAATKEAVENMLKDGDRIKAIIITGESVLRDAYADLQTISEDTGNAEIFMHPAIAAGDDFPTKDLSTNNSLLSSFGIEVADLSEGKGQAVLVYSSLNDGMLFPGDSAKGSPYNSEELTYYRDKLEPQSQDFKVGDNWVTYNKEFTYIFPRKGKPVIEIDRGTRTSILNKLRKGD